jgi:hypothetical protein
MAILSTIQQVIMVDFWTSTTSPSNSNVARLSDKNRNSWDLIDKR